MNKLLPLAVFLSCITPRFHRLVSAYFVLLVLMLGTRLFLKRRFSISYNRVRDISVFIIWLLVAMIQIHWSVDIKHTLFEIYYLVVGLISVITFNLIANDEDTFQRCFGAMTLALLIHCIIGCYEIITVKHLFEVGNADTLYPGKPVSIFFNRNDYSAFIFVSMAVALEYITRKFKDLKSYFLSTGTIVLCMTLVIVGGTDTVMLVLILILAVFFIGKIAKYSKGIRVAIVTSLLGLVGLLSFNYNSLLLQVITEFVDREKVRIGLIQNGLIFLRDSWGLGIGYGNTQYFLEHKSTYYIWRISYFHNWYLEILACGGILVFLVYVYFHINIIKRLYLIYKGKFISVSTSTSKLNKGMNKYIFFSFLIFSVVSISSSSNLYSEWVWMYFGLVSSYSNYLFQNIRKNIQVHSAG